MVKKKGEKMKRENEDQLDQENGQNGNNQSDNASKKRKEESKLRLLISSNVAGAIIGESVFSAAFCGIFRLDFLMPPKFAGKFNRIINKILFQEIFSSSILFFLSICR